MYFSGSSVPFFQHITVPVTCNASGHFMGIFNPNFLGDSTAAYSTLFINNDSTYNGTTSVFVKLLNVNVPFTLTQNQFYAYRLVSCCMYISSKVALLNRAGKLGGAVCPIPNYAAATATTAFVSAGGEIPTSISSWSIIENLDGFCEAFVDTEAPVLRMNWYPSQIIDWEYAPINDEDALAGTDTLSTQTSFIFYGDSLGASTVMNLEFYFNFECIPYVGTQNYNTSGVYIDTFNPMYAKMQVLSDKSLLCRPCSSNFIADNTLRSRSSTNGIYKLNSVSGGLKQGSQVRGGVAIAQ
jgi:hypothetical protein